MSGQPNGWPGGPRSAWRSAWSTVVPRPAASLRPGTRHRPLARPSVCRSTIRPQAHDPAVTRLFTVAVSAVVLGGQERRYRAPTVSRLHAVGNTPFAIQYSRTCDSHHYDLADHPHLSLSVRHHPCRAPRRGKPRVDGRGRRGGHPATVLAACGVVYGLALLATRRRGGRLPP